MTNQSAAIAAVAKKKCISLVTHKKDGTGVPSPIWFNVIGDTIVVTSPRDAWKVKRIRNNPRVEFATCTQRGRVTGPSFSGAARILPDSAYDDIAKAKSRRYFMFRLIKLKHRDQVAIEITPDR